MLEWKPDTAGDYVDSYQTSDASTLTHTITGVTSGSKYDLRVIAYNDVGGSLASGASRIVAATLPSAPNQPTLVS